MSSPPAYREHPPGPLLAPWVRCFWTSSRRAAPRAPSFHRVLPDGCMDLLFDFSGSAHDRTAVIGTMRRPITFTAAGAIDLIGVRFRPGGLPGLAALDATELTDERAALEHFWGRCARELWHRLAEAMPADRLRLLQQTLLDRAIRHVDPLVEHCVAAIESARGIVRISELEAQTGRTERQLERVFARHVGISPKTFARIARLRHAIEAAERSASPEWVSVALECGYADQSHLVREFHELAGLAPTEWLRETAAASDVGFLQDDAGPLH